MDAKIKLAGITALSFLIKYVVLKWASQKLITFLDWLIKKLLGNRPEELAVWLHYRQKRTTDMHQYPNPLRCVDGECKTIKLN